MTYIEMCNKKDRSQGSFSRRDSKGNGFPRSLVAVRGAGGGGGGGRAVVAVRVRGSLYLGQSI